MESQSTDFAKRRANHWAVYETKKEKYLSYFRIVGYDARSPSKQRGSSPNRSAPTATRSQMKSQRAVLCHAHASGNPIISAKPLFDACFPRA